MPVKTTHDGRTILTGPDYQRLRERVWLLDRGRCVQCGRQTSLTLHGFDNDMNLHHKRGRGMGGGRRDDTETSTETLCAKCHRGEHNQ
jgi:5-methylcytosine-specific restriction endonuclease McrA